MKRKMAMRSSRGFSLWARESGTSPFGIVSSVMRIDFPYWFPLIPVSLTSSASGSSLPFCFLESGFLVRGGYVSRFLSGLSPLSFLWCLVVLAKCQRVLALLALMRLCSNNPSSPPLSRSTDFLRTTYRHSEILVLSTISMVYVLYDFKWWR